MTISFICKISSYIFNTLINAIKYFIIFAARAQSSRRSDLNPISAIRRRITEGRQHSSVETARKQLDRRGFNPLHIAAKEDNLDAFKTIYEACDNITSTTTDGRNILHIAAYYGKYDICEYILT